MVRTIQYNALRAVGRRIEEIRVTMTPGGSLADAREEHVAWHDDADAAKAAIRAANVR